MALTQRGAAAVLGMTLKNYQQLERGINWTTGKAIAIDRRTALACSAHRAGLPPEGDNARPSSGAAATTG